MRFLSTTAAAIALLACDASKPAADRSLDGSVAGGGREAGAGGNLLTSGGSKNQSAGGVGGVPGSGGQTPGRGGRAGAGGAPGHGGGGASNAGGAGAQSGGGGSGDPDAAVTVPPSDLPMPKGAGDQPRPDGATANLEVLPWAGFRGAATYSFDDSSPSQIDHLDALSGAGVPLTFYLTTSNDWYGGYEAAWKGALAAGHELGNHTVHHCNFDAACNGAAAGSSRAEVDDATAYIVDVLGQPAVWTIAYPLGDTGYKPLAETRFFLGRGVSGGTVAARGDQDPFNLPVFAAVAGETEAALTAALDDARSRGVWVIYMFHSLAPNAEAWFAPVEVDHVTGSIAYARALEDVWIDSMVNVGAYWMGLRILEAATTATAGAGHSWSWSLPEHFPPGRHLRVRVDGGTLSQDGRELPWNDHGFYEVSLDAGSLSWAP